MPEEGLLSQLKGFIVGRPIPSHLAHHERLSRITGLAVLSSDPLSSVAYATEEILRVLVLVGTGTLGLASPIAFVIASILAVVVFSYRQTIHAYPSGGGAYIVSKDNLGETPALIAAASLLIDYILTVAVSIAAGVAAITSAFPQWHVNRVQLTLGFVLLLTMGNLRGIRESGRIFAAPTYFFVVTILSLIAVGTWQVLTGGVQPVVPANPVASTGETLTLFLLLTAFSNGCTAMTGVEAVSNGVPAFRPPEARNAAATMLIMVVLSITMFLGITLLAHAYHILPSETETVVSQLARGVFGNRGLPYYAVQAGTKLILVLAANTA
jgi:amino acid transporter